MTKEEKFRIRTYSNDFIDVVIGSIYGGEGSCGLTDGVDVRGILTEVDKIHDSAIIWSDKLKMPCAIKLRSLYAIQQVYMSN